MCSIQRDTYSCVVMILITLLNSENWLIHLIHRLMRCMDSLVYLIVTYMRVCTHVRNNEIKLIISFGSGYTKPILLLYLYIIVCMSAWHFKTQGLSPQTALWTPCAVNITVREQHYTNIQYTTYIYIYSHACRHTQYIHATPTRIHCICTHTHTTPTHTHMLAGNHSDFQLLRPLQLPGGVEHEEVGVLWWARDGTVHHRGWEATADQSGPRCPGPQGQWGNHGGDRVQLDMPTTVASSYRFSWSAMFCFSFFFPHWRHWSCQFNVFLEYAWSHNLEWIVIKYCHIL